MYICSPYPVYVTYCILYYSFCVDVTICKPSMAMHRCAVVTGQVHSSIIFYTVRNVHVHENVAHDKSPSWPTPSQKH